jgi:hypothetical protein
MSFKGHLIGGVLAGAGLATAASRLGHLPGQGWEAWAWVFGTTVAFSLFPDLDTSSVPQRWFFRLVFAALLYLGWTEDYERATLVGLLAVLPLLDHHRGWTHWKLSPLLVPLALGAVFEYWRARHAWFSGFSWENVRQLLAGHLVYLVACVVGWYTHLLLDGHFVLFPADRNHH